MITLDASVGIAVLAGADPHHAAARAIVAGEVRLVIHTMTLAEVLVGGVRVGREELMAARLEEMGVVELRRQGGESLDLARLRAVTGLKLPDCCVVLAAQRTGTALATFDARLARAARERGLEVLGAA